MQQLQKFVKDHFSEVDQLDGGMALIHHLSISKMEYSSDLLLTFFVYGNPKIDVLTADNKTALTLAVQVRN